MKKLALIMMVVCTCAMAQEHSNFGYAALAPQPASGSTADSLAAASSACTQGKVTVTSPTNGQTVTSPVLFQASATPDSGQSIVSMHVYVDSSRVYSVSGATVNTSLAVSAGSHSVVIKATESSGTVLSSSRISITVTTGVVATFRGCVWNQNGNKYQAVTISLNQPATVTFDANLYYGPSCDPAHWADEFGFGQSITLGTFSYIFWFTDFKNQMNMSALWKINNQTSSCINYIVAPPCP